MHQEEITYHIGLDSFKGYLAYQESAPEHKRPGVLIAPTWIGRDDFACQKAHALAELGYVSFALDLYGSGKVASNEEEAASLMLPLFEQRQVLQTRMKAAFSVLSQHPTVDPHKIGGIGFCFGGLAIIELLRSGAPVKGVVSFHGVLGSSLKGKKANLVPLAPKIEGALLILHGYRDPLVSLQDSVDLQKEMSDAHVDWQFNTYGLAGHSFTNPQQHDQEGGLYFEPKANARSWQAMRLFFEDVFV